MEKALGIWNDKLSEIWQLITQSPTSFKGGTLWNVVSSIHGALQAIGYALLVLFFVIGVMKTCGSLTEVKRPEHALRLFVRFALAKGVITYGMDLMLALLDIVQGVISTIMQAAGFGQPQSAVLPSEIVSAIEDCGFFESIPLWAVTLIGGLFIWVLSFQMILSVYGRFFKMFMYTAIAPIPLSTFAGEPTQSIGKSFLKSYASVCLEGAVIVLACVIFSAFASSPPVVDAGAAAASMVWSYIGEGIYSTVVLRDILQRNEGADQVMLQKIMLFLCSNIGSINSPSSIGNVLYNEGDIKGRNVAGKTVEKYISMLRSAYIFFSVGRYDVKGKQLLKTLGKNYIIDMGFRNMLLGYRDADRGHILENIVYLELLRRDYRVCIGKVGETEVDFVAEKPDDKLYIQVTESMLSPETRERELRPLQMIPDNYEKIVLSMDRDFIKSYDGIKSLNLLDWLLDKK